MAELLPCPFCGGAARVGSSSTEAKWAFAECSNSDCLVKPSTHSSTLGTSQEHARAIAIERWNTRVSLEDSHG